MIFVEGALAQERIIAEIKKAKSSFAEATLVEILERGPRPPQADLPVFWYVRRLFAPAHELCCATSCEKAASDRSVRARRKNSESAGARYDRCAERISLSQQNGIFFFGRAMADRRRNCKRRCAGSFRARFACSRTLQSCDRHRNLLSSQTGRHRNFGFHPPIHH